MNETEHINALKDEYLEHHGVKGQKWGVTRSREELGYDATPKKKKVGVVERFRQDRQKKKKAKLRAKAKAEAKKIKEAAKKAEEEAAKKEVQNAKTRERLLKAGNKDVELLYKNRHLLDDKELENRLKRINTENAIKKIVDSKPSEFDKAMKTIKKISGTMDDVYAVWDSKSMKAIRKALSEDDNRNRNQNGRS